MAIVPIGDEEFDPRMPLDVGVCMEQAGIESVFLMDTPTAMNYESSAFRKNEEEV